MSIGNRLRFNIIQYNRNYTVQNIKGIPQRSNIN